MAKWLEKTLGEVTAFIAKGIPPKYTEKENENTIRVLNQKCNRNFEISYSESRIHDCEKKKVPVDKMLRAGDVLINSTGTGTAGRVAQMVEVTVPTTIDGHMILIRPSEELDPIYYGYAVKSFQSQIEGLAEGSTGQTEINRRRLQDEVIIRYPSDKLVQKNIGSFLANIDEKIKTNKEINKNLLQQAVAMFNKFYDASTNQQPFTTLINVLGGGTPKTGNPEFWDGSIPFFTPKDVGTPYTFNTEKYITELGLKHCNSRLYPTNTTFVTARGTVGKISLAGAPMAMNQSCYALTSEIVDPLLVYFYVLKAVNALKRKASGAVFDAIVTRDFDGEIINILSDADSEAALSIIKPMMGAIHNNSKENMRLSAVRDTLLPKLMSGEINISSLDL